MKIARPRAIMTRQHHAVQLVGIKRIMRKAIDFPCVYFIDIDGRVLSYAALAIARSFDEPLHTTIVGWRTNIDDFNLRCSKTAQRIPSAKGKIQ